MLPDVEQNDVYAHHEAEDKWEPVPWRASLWTDEDEPRLAGEVSRSDDWYNVIQYGDILEGLGRGLEQHGVDPEGHVTVSSSFHRMTAKIGLDQNVEAGDGDEVALQLHARSGHSGYHGVKYELGAERLVCSNGMTAFVAEYSFEQTHSEPFQPQLASLAVDSMLEGVDTVKQRIMEAQNRELMNQDEALLVLLDLGLDRYLEQPVPDLLNALMDEVDDPEHPTLWETYNTATRALTHLARSDVPEYELDTGFEQAAQLLDTGYSDLPDPEQLGQTAVERRANDLIDDPNPEEYWNGESEAVAELLTAHGNDE